MVQNMIGILLLIISGIVIGLVVASYCCRKMNEILAETQEENAERKITYYKKRKNYIILGFCNMLLYALLYVKLIGFHGDRVLIDDIVVTILYCACTSLLLALVVIDWNTYEIPPSINVCIFILGLIKMGFDYENWSLYVIGFFAVSGFLYLLYRISGGSWIGGGDIKLMAAAGLLLGWKQILVAFVVGCVLGSIIHLIIMAKSKAERMLAFGPYLSLGIYFSMIWGEQLASWYLSLLKV